jgi:hypothetical protein
MYQTLIWPAVLRDEARSVRPPLDAEFMKRLANALVDCVGRNVELARNFLGRQMLVDQSKAIELARSEAADPRADRLLCRRLLIVHALGHV